MFNGDRLKELRLLSGMSRDELAVKMNLSEQAIWQFETGKVQPKATSTLFQLARLFSVETSYFYQKTIENVVDVSRIAFRNADGESKKAIKIQEVYLNKVDELLTFIEGFLMSPQATIFELVDNIEEMLKKGRTIEDIALFTRRKLNISDDNSDLMFKIELSGVYVLEKMLVGNADAYSLWNKKEMPYIVLGRGKSSVRRNFDLVHELGHLLLHRAVEFDELSKKESESKEIEANQFAGFFLMPRDKFDLDFPKIVGKKVSNPDVYIPLKQKYHVSIQALEYRAYKLGYLSVSQNNYFYRQITAKGYKKIEPLDREMSVNRPSRIVSMIDVILTSRLLTLENLLHQYNVSLDFLSEVLQIDKHFFDKYEGNRNTINNFNNVINLSQKKSVILKSV
jgi:Zn-dependent peptidase ImmA (M78 family)/DNA-binding XRE family transcriptional regulator